MKIADISILVILLQYICMLVAGEKERVMRFKLEVSETPEIRHRSTPKGKHFALLKQLEPGAVEPEPEEASESVNRTVSEPLDNSSQSTSPRHPAQRNISHNKPKLYFENYKRQEYKIVVRLGSNKNAYRLLFDITSPGIMVYDHDSPNARHRRLFKCAKSSTCVVKEEEFKLNNASKAMLVSDQAEFEELKVSHFEFLVNTDRNVYIPTIFNRTDGFLGLGKNPAGQNKFTLNIATLLYKSKFIPKNLFSFYLGNSSTDFQTDAEVLFGGINHDLINESSIQYINFSSREIQNSYVIDAELISLQSAHNRSTIVYGSVIQAALDSKENHLKVNSVIFEAILVELRALNFACDEKQVGEKKLIQCFVRNRQIKHDFPKLKFSLQGGMSFAISPQSYFKECDPVPNFSEIRKHSCFLGIEKTSLPYLVLGQQFFRNYYAVFDLEENKFGFGEVTGKFQPPKNRNQGYWYYTPMTLVMLWGIGMICCSVYFKKHLDRLNKLVYKVTLYIFCRRQMDPEDLEEDYSEQVDEAEQQAEQVQNANPNAQQDAIPNQNQQVNPPSASSLASPRILPSQDAANSNQAGEANVIVSPPLALEEEKSSQEKRNASNKSDEEIASRKLEREASWEHKTRQDIEREEEEEKNQERVKKGIVSRRSSRELSAKGLREETHSRKGSSGLVPVGNLLRQSSQEQENDKKNPSLSIIEFGDSDEEQKEKN